MLVPQSFKLALTAGKKLIHFKQGWHKGKRKKGEDRERKAEQDKGK